MKQTIIIIITFFSVYCGYCSTKTFNVISYGLDNTGSADCSSILQSMITSCASYSDDTVLYFPTGEYKLCSQINDNNGIYFCGESRGSVTLTSLSTNAVIAFAQGGSTSRSCGVKNITFSYSGNASSSGIIFGSSSYTAAYFTVENCDFKNFTLYGLEVYDGQNFFIKNVRILNHGISSIANGVGFAILSPSTRSNGIISNVYSEINSSSTSTTSTAIKLQSMNKLIADNIYGKGGYAACVSIDSLLNSKIVNLTVEAGTTTGKPGLVIRSTSPNNYILNGVETIGSFSKSIDIAGQSDLVSCSGVTLMNVVTNSIVAENYASVQNCKFLNVVCTDFELAPASTNSVASSNNQFINICITLAYPFSFSGNSSYFENIRAINANVIQITGNSNTLNNCYSENCNTYGFKIISGDNNVITNCHVKYLGTPPNPAPLWIVSGNYNVVNSFVYKGSTAPIYPTPDTTIRNDVYSSY